MDNENYGRFKRIISKRPILLVMNRSLYKKSNFRELKLETLSEFSTKEYGFTILFKDFAVIDWVGHIIYPFIGKNSWTSKLMKGSLIPFPNCYPIEVSNFKTIGDIIERLQPLEGDTKDSIKLKIVFMASEFGHDRNNIQM